MFYAYDSFKELLNVPELAKVGTAQERGAFIALHIDGLPVRKACEILGVSKSHVSNLATQFQTKLVKQMIVLRKKPAATCSAAYRNACNRLYERLDELRDPYSEAGLYKIGNFTPGLGSREDWAECTGIKLKIDGE